MQPLSSCYFQLVCGSGCICEDDKFAVCPALEQQEQSSQQGAWMVQNMSCFIFTGLFEIQQGICEPEGGQDGVWPAEVSSYLLSTNSVSQQ